MAIADTEVGSGGSKGPNILLLWRRRVQYALFGGASKTSKVFDITVICAILASVAVVMLESITTVNQLYGEYLLGAEWAFTIIFTVEYALRLMCAKSSVRYARSFYGVIDLLAVVPTYVSVILPGAHALLVIRLLRILRVFRVLKLVHYLSAGDLLMDALRTSWRKIMIFLIAVFALVTILGSLIYLIEGAENGYDSIPRSIYWAIVTLTTVGYGDISPQTPAGQALAAVVMIIGYAIIAVPTGIVSSEIALARRPKKAGTICGQCYESSHEQNARFCHGCGDSL